MRVRYSKSGPPRTSARYFRFELHEPPERIRSGLIERLLARAGEIGPERDWRREAFRLIAPHAPAMPGIGACALRGECGAGDGPAEGLAATVFVAAPVHYLAEISNVRMADAGILSLRQAEAAALAADFNRAWGDGMRLVATPSARLFLILDRGIDAATRDPAEARGRHIHEFLPSGGDSALLKRLMSEMEMWLFEHEVNRQRVDAGLVPVSALWLWGGGGAVGTLPPTVAPAAGDDVFFSAFAGSETDAAEDAPPAVVAVSAQPGSLEWREVESRWLAPAAADLRSGRIEALILSAGFGRVYLRARGLGRFWRRARPWWEYFTSTEGSA